MPIDPSTAISGKRLWLRAKDLGTGSITSWADQSGNSVNVTASGTAPTVATASTPSGGKSADFADGGFLQLTDLLLSPHTLGIAVASHQSSATGFGSAQQAIDEVTDGSSIWRTLHTATVGSPTTYRVKPLSAITATSYQMTNHNSARFPTAWTFEGSNDASSWTTLDTQTGQVFSDLSETKSYSFSNSTAYTYYRWVFTGTAGGTSDIELRNLRLNSITNVRNPGPGEIWAVIKSDGGGVGGFNVPWSFGSGFGDLYPHTDGHIYSDFGTTAQFDTGTAIASVTSWRLYRIATNGTWKSWLDNAAQNSGVTKTLAWRNDPRLGGITTTDAFSGNMAEVLVRDTISTSGEVADLIAYFNAEHGLTVPGGAGGTITGSVSATAPSPTLSVAGTVPIVGAVAATAPTPTVAVTGDVTGPPVTTGTVSAVAPSPTLNVTDAAGAGQTLEAGFSFGSALTSAVVYPQLMEGGFSFGSRLTQGRDWGILDGETRPTPLVVITQRDGTPVTALDEVVIGPLESGVGVVDSWRFAVDRDNAKGKRIEPVTHEAHLYRGNHLMSKGPIGPGRLEGGRMIYDCADPRWYLNTGRRIGRIPTLNWIYNGDFTKGTAGWTGAYKTGSVPEAKPEFYVVDEPESTSGKGLRIEGVDKVVTTTKDVETAAVFEPNSATYTSGGEALLISQADDIPDGTDIHIVGHTADRRAYGDYGDGLELSLARAQAARASLAAHNPTWTFSLLPGLRTPNENDGVVAGRGYYEQVASNSTETESAKNRRVALHYASTQTATGHKQYVAQRRYNVVQEVDMLVPLEVIVVGRMRIGEWLGAPADGNAMRVVLVDLETGQQAVDSDGNVIEGTATMNEATPRLRMHEYSASVDVPADGRTYYISVELYPPAGWSVWSDVGMYPQEQRGYFDMDQALIVRDLTLHVQDTNYGHGDLGIGTRTPLTGITRTREYPFRERMPYSTAIEELTALARGVEVDCEVTPTTSTIVTHYPRQGGVASLTLAHGGPRSIVRECEPLPASGRSLASSVVVQAWGIASTRMEQYARDETVFGGALLEEVIEAEGETPPGELDELATQHLARSIHPTAAWEVVIDPGRTSEVLDEIGKGDRVFLSLPDEGVHSLHRLVLSTWDPETDVLTLQLAPEEA